VWWAWVVGGLAVWLVLAAALALVIGRGIRLADKRSFGIGIPTTTADLPDAFVPAGARPAARRRALPLPPVGVALAACAVALETSGFVLRLDGSTGTLARLFSMDAPGSLPRLYVSALFAAAAVAGVAAAARLPGRRAWWLAVAGVAGSIASVKAGGTVHARAMHALQVAVGAPAAVALSGALAVAVLAGLWTFTRTERRDRRRVLGALALYGAASVGLSAVSAIAPAQWVAAATFLEESGEALAGIAFLMAVLVGVAPRLVLPASWVLRRSEDANVLQLSDVPATDTRH